MSAAVFVFFTAVVTDCALYSLRVVRPTVQEDAFCSGCHRFILIGINSFHGAAFFLVSADDRLLFAFGLRSRSGSAHAA